MQFYPHNISLDLIGASVSSSIARTGSFIANFAAIAVNRVDTASVALNITGAAGTNGTGFAVFGPTGSKGATGVTGPRGLSVFLLSGSWNTGVCTGGTSCYGYSFATTTVSPPGWTCDNNSLTTIYSTSNVMGEGVPIFYDSGCISMITDYIAFGGYAGSVWTADTNGQAQIEELCQTPAPPGDGGGGPCSGFCLDGEGCEPSCYCTTQEGFGTCVGGQLE